MCNRISMRKLVWIFWVLFPLCMSGCSTPDHTNTLIFGTNTKVGLDVSCETTGVPSISVGYKRQEAVWMPLLANKDAEGTPADCHQESCLFEGKDGNDKDTYSVIASFGASFSGKADKGEARAEGALAQFFATGLAARILAREGNSRLVAVQPSDTDLLRKMQEETDAEAELRRKRKGAILAWVAPNGTLDEDKWEALVDKADLKTDTKQELKFCKTLGRVSSRLDADVAQTRGRVTKALYGALGKNTLLGSSGRTEDECNCD